MTQPRKREIVICYSIGSPLQEMEARLMYERVLHTEARLVRVTTARDGVRYFFFVLALLHHIRVCIAGVLCHLHDGGTSV